MFETVEGLPREENIPPNNYWGQKSQAMFLVCSVRTSSLFSQLLQVFSSWQLKNLPSPAFSGKSLHLQLDLVKWHLPGILNLLKHCPCLKNLIIIITSYESTFHNTLSWTRPYEFDADEYWNMVDSPVQCLTHHLKKVVVAGHVMKKQVIQFLEYLFEHFVVLEEMKIFAEKQCASTEVNPSDLFA
ncbi:hypothetical protein KY284_030993 [Solanum tuberosum]|nr:hypothetical protein KY284_030993 [Solanum tuberosum]